MTKKTRVLLFLLSASVLLFAYLILSSEMLVTGGTKNNGQEASVISKNRTKPVVIDLRTVRDSHRTAMSKILDDYTVLIDKINAGTGAAEGENGQDDLLKQAEKIKSRIAGLKAPSTEYKGTHLDLVLSIDRMENFINDGNNAEKENGLKLLAQARQDFESLSRGRN